MIRSTKLEYNALRTKELALEKEINKKKEEAIRFDDDMMTYNILKRDVDSYRRFYSDASQRLQEIKLTQAQTTSNIKIVEKASVPLQPLSSRNTMKMALSVIIGCSIGIGFAFIRDYFDTNLKDIDEVERYLQIPCLSVIPSVPPGLDPSAAYSSSLWTRHESLASGANGRSWPSTLFRGTTSDRRGDRSLIHHHITTLQHKGGTILEAYNVLRTRLQSSSPDIKTVLVTSAVPSEGRSTTTVLLGMAFARLGRKVLLVDTDLRQPSLHGRFRVQNNAGLIDILAQGHEWQQVIQDTALAYLQILPAGAGPHGYPSDVLSLATMQKLVEHLRHAFDLVIFDAPSMLALPDAEILAPVMDGVLLVHSPGKCAKEDVLEATRLVQRAGGSILGIVINNVSQKEQKYYYNGSQSRV
jgi:capsular exopolysaccharide synthesis family protein